MGEIGIRIEHENKEKLFEMAESHFPSNREFLDSTDISKTNFNSHRNGDSNVMGFEPFYKMVKVVNTTDPVFRDLELEKVEGDTWGSSVEIEDPVQELTLNYFSTEELKEIFDKSAPQVKKYRNNKSKYVPKEGFREAYSRMNEQLDSSIAFSVDLLEINSHNSSFGETNVLAESWNEKKLLEKGSRLHNLNLLLETNPEEAGRASQAGSAVEEMKQNTYSKPSGRHEGHFYSLLSQAGYLDKWGNGNKPTYIVEAGEEELELARHLAESYKPKETSSNYSDDEVFSAVREKSDEVGRTPLLEELPEGEDYPSSHTVRTRFGGYNNLLFRLGLEPNSENYGDEELLDILNRQYVEGGFTKPSQDCLEPETLPSQSTYKRRFGSFERAVKEAGIPMLSEEDDSDDYLSMLPESIHEDVKELPKPAADSD